jgi:hypothetical protein
LLSSPDCLELSAPLELSDPDLSFLYKLWIKFAKFLQYAYNPELYLLQIDIYSITFTASDTFFWSIFLSEISAAGSPSAILLSVPSLDLDSSSFLALDYSPVEVLSSGYFYIITGAFLIRNGIRGVSSIKYLTLSSTSSCFASIILVKILKTLTCKKSLYL